ncbi:MAG: hypothetical protein JST82_16385 [Bacteroidetes bacterium]|nr:hypothetical protein [Bacteroidota bacterium]
MKGLLKCCLPLLFLGIAIDANAQKLEAAKTNTVKPKYTGMKKPKPIRTELSAGLRLNTDGWGIFIDKGWVKSNEKFRDQFYNVKLFQIEFDEKKRPEETKHVNDAYAGTGTGKAKPFIFGKANNFYTFKLGYGGRKMIAGKPEQGNVSMHLIYLGGISLGLLKPYYVLSDSTPAKKNSTIYTRNDITYTDSTQASFLDKSHIEGASGFSKGLGQTKIIPGIHLKAGMHFDFAASKHGIVAVETGLNFEYYTSQILLLVNKDATSYFLNAYVSVQFGKRW